MDKIVDVLLNWQVLLASFAIFAVLQVLRAIGTKRDPKTKEPVGGFAENTWFKQFLPVYPYIISLGLVFIPGIPLPAEVTQTLAMKILYSIWAAFLSDKVYQLIKKFFEERGIRLEALEQQKAAEKVADPLPGRTDPTPKDPTP